LADACQQDAVTEGLRAGSAEAWTALYDAHCEAVWRYAERLLGADRDSIADVVQETFLAAARSARSYDAERGSPRSWLMGIVHLQAAQHFRRRKRDTKLLDRPTAAPVDPENELLRREQAEHVRRVLADMPADYAWLLVAKYVDDEPIAAIAAALAANAEAVRSKLARARRLFRQAISTQPVRTL
jgi:RNA polymerase sigma-70 factor (ECF subfamily)